MLLAFLSALSVVASAEKGDTGFPLFKSQLEEIVVEKNAYVEVLCNATSDSPITYGWYTRFGEEIHRYKVRGSLFRKNVPEGALLVFDRIQRDEAGRYVCWAKNDAGSSRKFFDVFIDDSRGPPVFDNPIEFVNLDEDSYEEVYCEASGHPAPSYKWYDELSNEIGDERNSSEVYCRESGNGTSLVFNSTRRGHDGAYTCAARNTYGLRTKLFKIKVVLHDDRLYFDYHTEFVVVEEGDYAEILCNASTKGGQLSVNYTWTDQNGTEISSNVTDNSTVYSIHYRNSSKLIFAPAEANHSGVYNCTAANARGEVFKTYYIEVSSREGNESDQNITIRSVQVLDVRDTMVEFSIQVNKYYDYVYAKYQEALSKDNGTVQWRRGEKFSVSNLIPSGNYTFEFQTDDSPWQKRTRVVLLPSAPEVIIRGFKGGLLEIGWRSSWDDYRRATITNHNVSYRRVGQRGDDWEYSDCAVSVDIPVCAGKQHVIAGLQTETYYEVQVRARTLAGAGSPYTQKIFSPKSDSV